MVPSRRNATVTIERVKEMSRGFKPPSREWIPVPEKHSSSGRHLVTISFRIAAAARRAARPGHSSLCRPRLSSDTVKLDTPLARLGGRQSCLSPSRNRWTLPSKWARIESGNRVPARMRRLSRQHHEDEDATAERRDRWSRGCRHGPPLARSSGAAGARRGRSAPPPRQIGSSRGRRGNQ
jgi:hypothetical protein